MSSVPVCPTFRKVFVAAILGACVFLIPNGVQSATSDSATLHWAPNQESDLGGYRVYHGTTPGIYGSSQDAGNTSTYRFASLESNKTHYFTVTAYDLSKNESLPSPEVFKTIIGPDSLLSVSLNGEGTVTSSPASLSCSNGTCSGSFTQGSKVTLTAAPSSGSTFSGWSGACTGTGSCVVALSTSSASVKATFAVKPPPPSSLSVTLTGDGSGAVAGGVSCSSGTCSGTFTQGSKVTLTAAPSSGSTFSGWSGACTGTGSCVVALSTSSASVKATFAVKPPPPSSLSVTLTGDGSGTVAGGVSCSSGTCSGTFTQGSKVTLTAAPSSGSTFSGWSGACTGTGSCVVALSTSSASVKATFAVKPPPPSSLSVTLTGDGSGAVAGGVSCSSGTCSGTFTQGSKVTLTAAPSSGSTFSGWSGACTGTGSCVVALSTAEASVRATFAGSPSPSSSLKEQQQLAKAKYRKQQEMAKAEFLKRREMAKAEHRKRREMVKAEYRKRQELDKSEHRKQREMAKAEYRKQQGLAKAEYLKQRELAKDKEQQQLAKAKYRKQQEMAKAEFLKRREMAKAEHRKQREMVKAEYRKRQELDKSEHRKQREMAKAEYRKQQGLAKAEYLKQRELLAKA